METLLTWLASFVLVGIIISPFFWLRFLKEKSVWNYIFLSSVVTLGVFGSFIYFIYRYLGNILAKGNSDISFFYDDMSFQAIMIVHFLIIISPFIFTKIAFGKIKIKSFLISSVISVLIAVAYIYVFVFMLLPKAFMDLNKYL
jgi:hypothetical protein